MSLEIRIIVPDDCNDPAAHVKTSLAAIGYAPCVAEVYAKPVVGIVLPKTTEPTPTQIAIAEAANAAGPGEPSKDEAEFGVADVALAEEPEKPKRTRRTKAEMEAARAEEAKPAISTGEERIDPTLTATDSAEDAAQDAADEAAEQAARRGDDKKIVLDDLRKAYGAVSAKHGIKVATMLPKYFGCELVDMPEARYADVLEELEVMPGIDKADLIAMLGTPAVAEAAANFAAPEPTREELLQAMFRFAEYADGVAGLKTQKDAAAVKDRLINTFEWLPGVFTAKFGDKVTTFNQVPDEGLGIAIAAIDEAISEDRFERRL